MSVRVFAALASAAVLIIGYVLLFMPVNATADGLTEPCGTANAGNTDPAARAGETQDITHALQGYPAYLDHASADLVAACDSSLSTQRLVAWPLIGVGAVALIGAGVINNPRLRFRPVVQADGDE